MISTRALAVALTLAVSAGALAMDRPMQGGSGQSMPMGPSAQMPMPGSNAGQPGAPSMSTPSGTGSPMPMGMGMMPMPGGGSGQGNAMAMPSGNNSGGMMMCGMPMMQGMMGGSPGGMSGPGMAAAPGKVDFLEGRLAFLKTELKLANSQAPLWEAFAAAVRAGQTDAMPTAAAGASITQRLDADEHQQAMRLNATRQLKSAVGPLYSALDDNQKRIFDQLSQHQLGLL